MTSFRTAGFVSLALKATRECHNERKDCDTRDEEILVYEVSDEALEAAASADRVTVTIYYSCAIAGCPGDVP